jgi:hypothetical protein
MNMPKLDWMWAEEFPFECLTEKFDRGKARLWTFQPYAPCLLYMHFLPITLKVPDRHVDGMGVLATMRKTQSVGFHLHFLNQGKLSNLPLLQAQAPIPHNLTTLRYSN